MHLETHLFIDIVAIHRELLALLPGVPGHRKLIREAFGQSPESDIEFIRDRFRDMGRPDIVDVEAASAFAWLPASATPRPDEIAAACR